MTNKMRLIFVITATIVAAFLVLSTPFVVDIADQVLLLVAHALGLHETPTVSVLAVLAIPGLYLVFRQGRRS